MSIALPLIFALQAVASFRIDVRGSVFDASGAPLSNAVVELVEGGSALPRMDTLTDANGLFAFDSGTSDAVRGRASRRADGFVATLERPEALRVELRDMRGVRVAGRTVDAARGAWRIVGIESLLPHAARGVFVGTVSARGRVLATVLVPALGGPASALRLESATSSAAARTADATGLVVEFRKVGFLPKTVAIGSSIADLGVVVLSRDPLESRIDSVMALMTLDDKIGQMTQGEIGTGSKDLATLKLGSLLSGGGDLLPDYAALQKTALSTARKIPMIYGIDAVHGTAKADNATVFPHHIGLGATRDSALVRRVGEVTAQEMLGSGTDWTFAPCIAVPRDERWGRTYEGFGETPELAVSLGAAEVRGLQGASTPWRVIACAKHFVADGGTTWGTGTQGTSLDQGDAQISEDELRRIHLPGYRAAVRAGVGTVMASYSFVNGVRNHANKKLLTDVLKTEMGFDGFVISDWLAIEQIDSFDYSYSVEAAVNAGVDMSMEPGLSHATFVSTLRALVNSGAVAQSRIDDAVRRILRVKYRAGRMDSPYLPTFVTSPLGTAEHRAVAREAVRKSLVVLVNDSVGGKPALPLPSTGVIAIHGTHADNTGLQCGGWTLGWQGQSIKAVTGATSILQGFRNVMTGATITSSTTRVLNANAAIFVVGEQPYAEMKGDLTESAFADFDPGAATTSLMASYVQAGVPVVTVFVSGRPRPVPTLLKNSDAFVAAWLPGSEGAGVADVLSGAYPPVGVLPHSWPKAGTDVPLNAGDGKVPAFPYGFGLTW